MTMKTLRIITGFLALSTAYLQAATPVSAPKKFDWGITSVPTPLEEYGLSLGDITMTRVFNPIGQLQVEDPIIIARRVNQDHITNPWQELTPGTGLIVDGIKAVVREIQPEMPPSEKQTGLRVKLIVETISATTMTLEWNQVLHKLNSAETKPMRDETVDRLKKGLRVGAHLIINGGRRIIAKQNLSYNPPTSKKNRDLQFEANYYALEGAKGTLSGRPSSSENITDAAWNLKDGELKLPQNTAQIVTWKFWARDGDQNLIPTITVLHRARGVVSKIHLASDERAEAHVHSTHEGQIHTRKLKWEQLLDGKGKPSWQLTDNRDDFIELFKVNDSNISFKITPDSLLRANRNALEFFKSKKENTGDLQLSSKILDPDTMANQIKSLQEIVKSDASESIKLDAKRQAVIYLARFYEHKATELQASRQEQIFRAEIKREEARKYERHAWLTKRKIELLKEASKGIQLSEKEGKPNPDDLHVKHLSIANIHNKLTDYTEKIIPVLSNDDLQIQFSSLMRQNKALNKEADRLRVQAEKLKPSTSDTETSEKDPIVENYNLALHFWSEYIYRTEGLKRSAQQLRETGVGNNTPLKETGIGSNTPPSDPYLPEILLRQAWIYRQMGLAERAISTYYDVLTGATKQKINNLTRFSRIALVARSQIANSYWETAKDREDINEAIDLYTRLLPSDEESFVVGQELDKMEELDSSQLRLNLLRALFKSDEYARTEIRRKERKLKELKRSMVKQAQDSASTYLSRNLLEKERKKIQGEIAAIEQDRTKNWTLLKKNAEQFIESYNETEPNLRYDGEIRYFQIVANEALGNALHVQRDMQVLLDNESIPTEFQQAWLATRVRVMIDVSNLLFSEAVKAEESASALSSKKATIVLQSELQPKEAKGKEPSGSRHARPQNLKMAINGYEQALLYDQTYRSQIMLRQQIAWCQERLGQIEKASETYKTIGHLCEMHAKDLNSTLKVVQFMAKLKFDNLTQEETHDKDSQEKSSDS